MFERRPKNNTKPSVGPSQKETAATRFEQKNPEPNATWQSLALNPVAIQSRLTASQPEQAYNADGNPMAHRTVKRKTAEPYRQSRGSNPPRGELSLGTATIQRKLSDPPSQKLYSQKAAQVAATVGFETGYGDSPVNEHRQNTEAAEHGVSGSGGALPFLGTLERAFGRHDLSGTVAHTDGAAQKGSQALGAKAFTVANHVVFGGRPDLHTVAHEAAHVVQQRGGLTRSEGIGHADDQHERHADAVATLVTQGRSAESLLNQYAPSTTRSPTGLSQALIQLLELSYDDGPDANTRVTLEALVAGGGRATFYLVGQKVEAGDNWRIVFDLAAAGNWLGNHAFDWNNATDNHIFMQGTPSERASKILKTEFAIRNALVKGKADAQTNKKWDAIPAPNRSYIDDVIATGTGRFRTPGFRSHWYSPGGGDQQAGIELASQVMEAAGLRRFVASDSVTVDTKDWEKGKTQTDVELAVARDMKSDSDSILLHSRVAVSAAATPSILALITQKGFTYQPGARGSTTGATAGGFADVNTSPEWLDSFAAIERVGPANRVNRTDPIDRTVTTQIGVAWLDYGGDQYLAVIVIENSSIDRNTKLGFISFVHKGLKDKAIARGLPNQPRGIQTIPRQYVLYAPAGPASETAKK